MLGPGVNDEAQQSQDDGDRRENADDDVHRPFPRKGCEGSLREF